jgi:hypothetical protein
MLELTVRPEGTTLRFQPEIVALAGFSGRDQRAVRKHIEELARIGVRTPEEWPVIYAVTTDRVTTASRIEVLHGETSGELEFAIVLTNGQQYVAVASDHTDRKGERVDIALSKQAVQRVISRDVWRVADVADRWDDITLRSYVRGNGDRRLYQSGNTGALLPVDRLVDLVQRRCRRPLGNAIIFSGTLPVIGSVVFAPHFEVEMTCPAKGWTLRASYDVVVNQWLGDSRT